MSAAVALVLVAAGAGVAPVAAQAPQVSVVAFSVTPESPGVGEPITLRATVQNSERSDFGFEITRVEVRLIGPQTETVLTGQSEVGTLGPGDRTDLTQTVRFSEPGVKRLTVVVYGTSTGRGGGTTVKYPVTVVVEDTQPRLDTADPDLLARTDNDFTVTVSNGKSTPIRDVRVRLSGEDIDIEEAEKSAAVVAAGASLPFEFVLSSETPGTRRLTLELSYTAGGLVDTLTETQTVTFRPLGDETATVTNVTQTPERARPGGTFDLSVRVRNRGGTLLRDLTFALDLNGTVLRAGAIGTDIYVEELPAGESRRISYRLKASEDAGSGIVTLPLTYRYTTVDGRTVTDRTAVSVEVLGTPVLRPFLRGVEGVDGRYSVTVDVANVGEGVARSARIRLDGSSYFLGDIPAGEFETATLTVAEAGRLTARLNYSNGFNEPLSVEQSVTVTAPAEGPALPLWSLGALGVVVAVAGVWWWRRWRA